MAEALLRHYGEGKFEVQSAGVFAYPGSDVSIHAKEALAEKGIVIDHAAQQVNDTLVDWADIVVTMTENHKQIVLGYYPSVEKKLDTLYGLTEGVSKDISDPFGGSLSIYKETLEEMEKLVQTLLKKHSEG
ncbi:Low molecular weight phosphotyrosine protein phosphatase [Bacillus mycoides]|nr:Low molecular weight phosphotyrosine protein phosphatase [Bacillus mycoides]EEL67983.1 Low molecular weight phosphotyrosine protein phosphatase [Bacillus mycoides]EEL96724.1 Low molecular weight phosphotyrosine protein phosphatase [Bacillus mycoides DSM 2048]